MKNFLRYFGLLCLVLFGMNATAQTTIKASTDLTTLNETTPVTTGDFTFTVSKNGGQSAPVFVESGGDMRIYAKGTLTISTSSSDPMTSIVFNISAQGLKRLAPITASTGTIATQASGDKTVTWTGSATEITFTVGEKANYGSDGDTKGGQLDFDSVVITGGGEGGGGITPDPDPDPNPDGNITFDFDKDNDVLTLFGFEGYSSSPETGYVDTGDFKESKTGTVEGVELTVSPNPASLDGGKDTPNRVWGKSPKLRLYGGTMTVKAPAGHKFTAMTFTSAWNSKGQALYWSATANTGTLTVGDMNNQTVVWAGEAEEVVFTIEKNTQLKKLVVTLDGEAPDFKPVISGTTPFDEETTVTITPLYEDDVIYYTTDGTDPTTASTLYRGPFTINATTTVKAVEEDAISGDLSEVVEKTFTKKEMVIETVTLPYTEKLISSQGKFYINNVEKGGLTDVWKASSYGMTANGRNCTGNVESWFISPKIDASGATDLKLSFDQNLRYFADTETAKAQATLWVREGETGAWTQVTIPTHENASGNDFSPSGEINLSAYAGKTIQLGFKYLATTEDPGRWEIKNFTVQDGDIVITYQDETIESLNSKTDTPIDYINLKLNNAVVVYVDPTQGAYVREGDYAILFFQTGLNLTEGQTLTGDIKFNYAPHYGLPETKDIQDVTTLEGVTTGTTEFEPVETTLDELIALKHVADLVVVKGVTLSSETVTTGEGENQKTVTNYYMNLGGKKVQIFDKFNLMAIPTVDVGNMIFDVIGIFGTIYKSAPEIYLTQKIGNGNDNLYIYPPTINGDLIFENSTKVTIVPNNSNNIVYYTTDNSTPSPLSNIYKGPFTITKTTTVKAIETNSDGFSSQVAKKDFYKIIPTNTNDIHVYLLSFNSNTNSGTSVNLKVDNDSDNPIHIDLVEAYIMSGNTPFAKINLNNYISAHNNSVFSINNSTPNSLFYFDWIIKIQFTNLLNQTFIKCVRINHGSLRTNVELVEEITENNQLHVFLLSADTNVNTGAYVILKFNNSSYLPIHVNNIMAYIKGERNAFDNINANYILESHNNMNFSIRNPDPNALFASDWVIKITYTNSNNQKCIKCVETNHNSFQTNMELNESDDVTGVNNVINATENSNTLIYNLSGQRVNDTYRGIVIKNGKKFVQK